MKRIFRWIGDVLMYASLLQAVWLGYLWQQSYSRDDVWFTASEGQFFKLESSVGFLLIAVANDCSPYVHDYSHVQRESGASGANVFPFSGQRGEAILPAGADWGGFAISAETMAHFPGGPTQVPVAIVTFPYWAAVILSGLPPMLWFAWKFRRHRHPQPVDTQSQLAYDVSKSNDQGID